MSINEFESVGIKARNLISQVKVDTGYKTTGLLDEYYEEKNKLDAKQDEIERTITDDDGETEKPSALDYITASLTGIAGVLSAAAPLLQGNGSGGGASFDSNQIGDSTANGLDAAVAKYSKDPSSKNKMKLEQGLNDAKSDLSAVKEGIGNIEKENPTLEKAINGDFSEVFTQIAKGVESCNDTIAKSTGTINDTNAALDQISGAMKDNQANQVTVNNLTEETKQVLGTQEQTINIKLNQEVEQKGSLNKLWASFNEYNTKVEKDEEDIVTQTQNVSTATDQLATAAESYRSAEAMSSTVKDENGKDVANKKRDEAIKNARKAMDKAQSDIDKAQKALQEAKNQKKADNEKMLEYARCIDIGDKNLADIVSARTQAEDARDKSNLQLDQYATKLRQYIKTDEVLGIQQNEANNSINRNEALIVQVNEKGAKFEEHQIDAENGKAFAQKSLDANKEMLAELNSRRTLLSESIGKAEKALGPKSKPADADKDTGSPVAADGSAKPAATGGTPDDKPAANGDKKTPTVEEFKASDDYAEFENNWKANNNGQAPNEADIERWIKENINN